MGPAYLDQFVGVLNSTVGGCYPGEKAIFRSHNLHTDLKDIEWFDLFLYGITGRRLEENSLHLLKQIFSYTSYPDSRIWNNRVSALGGTNRSTFSLSTAASLGISEADVYGSGVSYKAITFFINTQKKILGNYSIKECIKEELKINRGIPGYGRPLTAKDERIQPILLKAEELGLNKGPHLKLAFDIDQALAEGRWRLKINYAAVTAALAADIGLSPTEYYHFAFPCFFVGMIPCYIEASEKPAGTLFPTPCSGIDYIGKEKRSWKKSKQL